MTVERAPASGRDPFTLGHQTPLPPKPAPEEIIMSTWQGNVDKPLVSIICHTYNHVQYVKHALHGFLMQKTDFPFEIIIHDDASTDGTDHIILGYAKRYPSLIRFIRQGTNQHSLGRKPVLFTLPEAKGQWIAFCEGDDFWISEHKLDKQVSAVESFANAAICFHQAIELDERNGVAELICDYGPARVIDSSTIVNLRGGSMPSASLLFKNAGARDYLRFMTEASPPVGDFFLQAYWSFLGEVVYMDEPLSVYRRNALGSWTSSQKRLDERRSYYLGMVRSIDRFNAETTKFSRSAASLYAPLHFYFRAYVLCEERAIDKTRNLFRGLAFIKRMSRTKVLWSFIAYCTWRVVQRKLG